MHATFLDNLLRALSWTFIHSLWQGLILTILAGMVMLGTKKLGSSLRYFLLCSLFFLFLGSAGITFLIEWNTGTTGSSGLKLIANQPDLNALFQDSVIRQLFEKIAFFMNANAQWIVFIWLIILIFKTAKMMLDMVYVYRLRNHHQYTPGEEWTLRMQSLCTEIGIRKKVALIESALVRIPIVVGHLKPMVLVPVGILTNLPAGEVEAVLLHELAHIRRHDYLINFIQRIAELLFFFNPALLWVSSLLRIERENCCDDIAIAKTKNKLQFVEALIRFKEHSLKHQEYALGLFGKKNLLLQRMSRIVYNRNKSLSRAEGTLFILSFIILLLLIPGLRRPETKRQTIAQVSTVVNGNFPFATEPDQDPTRPPVKRSSAIEQDRLPIAKSNKEVEHTDMEVKEAKDPDENRITPIEYVANGRLKTAVSNEQIEKDALRKEQDPDHTEAIKKQLEHDRQALDKYKEQWEKDRMQADLDRQVAIKDREQAQKDRERAELDRKQAEKDRKQAEIDRREAQLARDEAEKARHSELR
jgi:bla regulator protein BlaR1